MEKRLDIILLGVTGFTGKNALRYLRKFAIEKHLTWGVAGRDIVKMKEILDNFKEETNDESISKITVITVDLSDEQSIKAMVQKARIVINCCGPYRFLGEAVVKACIESGTHHVDVSGEPYYMEKMQMKYNDMAKEKGVYIVSACGFESIPYDMGVMFLTKKFQGTLHSVEAYLKRFQPAGVQTGNIGTWNSAIHEVGAAGELRKFREENRLNPLPKYEPNLKKRLLPFKPPEHNEDWAIFLPVPDRSVMLRTQRYFHEKKNARPIQIQTYLQVESLWNIFLLAIVGMVFLMMVRFRCGRNLLLKYPKIFSAGRFDKVQPSEENTEKTWFAITLIGKGWKEDGNNENEQKGKPNRGIIARVRGQNPAYGSTTIALTLAAIMIITETSKMPDKGGVFPPGAAFAETSLIEQLHRNNVTFDVIEEFAINE